MPFRNTPCHVLVYGLTCKVEYWTGNYDSIYCKRNDAKLRDRNLHINSQVNIYPNPLDMQVLNTKSATNTP